MPKNHFEWEIMQHVHNKWYAQFAQWFIFSCISLDKTPNSNNVNVTMIGHAHDRCATAKYRKKAFGRDLCA